VEGVMAAISMEMPVTCVMRRLLTFQGANSHQVLLIGCAAGTAM